MKPVNIYLPVMRDSALIPSLVSRCCEQDSVTFAINRTGVIEFV